MQAVSRFMFTILIALVTALGAFALVGCTNDTQQSQASQSQAAESSATEGSEDGSADDEDQENCYGDDLPAVKQK